MRIAHLSVSGRRVVGILSVNAICWANGCKAPKTLVGILTILPSNSEKAIDIKDFGYNQDSI